MGLFSFFTYSWERSPGWGVELNPWGTRFRFFLILASICIVITSMGWLNITYIAECSGGCSFLTRTGDEIQKTKPKPFLDLNFWTKAIYIIYWVLITIFFIWFAFAKSNDCSYSKKDIALLFAVWAFFVVLGITGFVEGSPLLGRWQVASVYIGLILAIIKSFRGFSCFTPPKT